MFKFGLIKSKGVWNKPTTDITFGNSFDGYKPVQSVDVFGLINSTDGNFWLLSEDDDHYFVDAKISEETIRNLHKVLSLHDFSDTKMFSFKDNILKITLLDLYTNKKISIQFAKAWIPSLIKTLDIDNPIPTTKKILPVWEKSVVPDKVIYPLMTPTEYVYKRISEYPSLYANKNFEISKFKVYDHFFNTLGNGYSTFDEVENTFFKKEEINIEKIKRFSKELSFDGYSKVETFLVGEREVYFPDSYSLVARNVFEEEKINYPEVIYWRSINPNVDLNEIMAERNDLKFDTEFRPYPNFQKQYSLIWKLPEIFSLLNDEWKKEIIWFYEKCEFAINNGCFKNYSEFPTGSKKIDQRHVEEMKKFIGDRTNEQVSKDYEVYFDGNVEDFLNRKWLKTKKEYLEFIKETIEYIKSK